MLIAAANTPLPFGALLLVTTHRPPSYTLGAGTSSWSPPSYLLVIGALLFCLMLITAPLPFGALHLITTLLLATALLPYLIPIDALHFGVNNVHRYL